MSTIEVTNLSKSYGDVTALDDVSFTIPDGEFVVVLGQSGAGKSTLLRCLNGITRPTSGSITIDDANVMGPRNDVAMIFQQHYILGQMSAYSNALTGALGRTSFLGSLLGLYDGDDKQEALRALETVGLLDEANQRAGKMSGGQQQRVGIARALVQNPNLLLADEPVASLDPASAETVMRYIRDAADERDLTTIASLHQVNIAREFGERFIGMKDGQIVFDGYREDFDVDVIDRIYGDIETEAIREEQADEPPENNAAATSGARSHEY
ncbi:phosphonate ABC transporter ATP-binding protein [Haloferax volcanii]|uniref:Phosphonate ABC transporter ATP-binding protein n=2 Tax=Haloferax volcanii TaxID=2246 RepID=A0A558GCC8_HALVO|nr:MULTISPECIES: phosphonate ABC transporter ATP-binding protein [Haloferax]ELK56274.1 putative phosphate/phosphonate ABC transporter ATP-binding protein [Haloferax sp. BAB-2207]ELZ70695.1 putative phosphate/phosphonate ABC transporter ATP-binding protein [Haloferax lucentense DSM 14919]NLV01419.1 phosphonate ABC transporter ATP-binding protein [Haloferax alexandrinus]TVT95428.1 phosphonate ABC transporter ATP-binding protein [Haloferax volcanii]